LLELPSVRSHTLGTASFRFFFCLSMLVLRPVDALPRTRRTCHGGRKLRHLTDAAPRRLPVAVTPVAPPRALHSPGQDQQHRACMEPQAPNRQELRKTCPAKCGAGRESHLSQRILCYGDSNTAGFCLGGRRFEPYGKSLAEALTAMGMPCEAIVCGLSGLTAAEMAAKIDAAIIPDVVGWHGRGLVRTLEDEGPFDLALIMAGTNDLGCSVPAEAIVKHVSQLHAACHKRGVPTVALAPPTSLKKPLRAAREDLASLLASFARTSPGVVNCFDIEELLPRKAHNGFWEPDELHLSAAGSIELGRILAMRAFHLLSKLALGLGAATTDPVKMLSSSNIPSLVGQRSGAASPAVPVTTHQCAGSALDDLTSYAVGDEVEAWSVTQEMWCHAIVEKVVGGKVSVRYAGPGGRTAIKEVWRDHEHLRPLLPSV